MKVGEYFFPEESFMGCSHKCKNKDVNHTKKWSFLWIGDPVLEEEDVFEADSHVWSQEVLSFSSTSLRLLMFPQVWSRAWCSYNLNWDFLLSWKVEDSNSALWVLYFSWEVLKSSETWRVAAPSRDAPPGRAVRPVSVKVSLCQTQLLPFHSWFLAWDWFLPLGNDLAYLATISVASCGQPPALQWGRCTWQHVLIPVSRDLTAGDKFPR